MRRQRATAQIKRIAQDHVLVHVIVRKLKSKRFIEPRAKKADIADKNEKIVRNRM